MPSCSVHHCVLFLLTLTLTTDPGAAAVVPIYANLHQSVTLPCGAQCSGWAKWSLDSNRDVVFARCDQTSCTSVQQGFNMSHDQFKRGDLSLTITNPDYSMRETYTCECDYSDYVTVRLKIFTVFSEVQMSPGEDLKLDLSVPESVEVIYRGSVLSDGVQICTVTDRTLQCNTEYTPRTSLSNSELTLRNMWRGESGTYTIRNLDHEEDIRVYAVSVSGLTSGETAGIVILVLFLVLLIAGVMYYMWRKAEREKEETERKRREVKSDMEAVDDLMAQAKLKPRGEQMAALQQVEEKIKALEQKYRGDSEHKELVTLFCKRKREELVESDKKAVNDLIAQAELNPPVEQMAVLQQVEEKIKALEQKYRLDSVYSELITLFCNSKRSEIELYRKLFGPQLGDVQTGEVKSAMLAVDKDINETLHRAAVEEAELQRVEKKIKHLEKKYRDDRKHYGSVMMFCYSKREYLRLYREVFTPKNTSLQLMTQEVKTVMNDVDDLIKKAELKPGGEQEEEMREVLQKITDVELKYSRTAKYYRKVTRFCKIKREELDICRNFYETHEETPQIKEVEKEMDAVDDLIQKVLHTPPGEQEEEVFQDAEEKIYYLIELQGLGGYCLNKREELDLCRKIYGTQIGSQQPGTEEVMNEIEEVYKLIGQNKHRPSVEVEKKIDDLEKKSTEYREYYSSVGMFWNKKRTDMELCSRLGLLKLEFNSSNTEKEMEEVVKTLNELKLRVDQNRTVTPFLLLLKNRRVSSSLEWINKRCREQRDSLDEFKQQPSRGETDDKMIRVVETHLRGLELWCVGKESELEIYRGKLKQRGGEISNAGPQTSRSEGGENTALLQV